LTYPEYIDYLYSFARTENDLDRICSIMVKIKFAAGIVEISGGLNQAKFCIKFK
jgi:hypothetical protein